MAVRVGRNFCQYRSTPMLVSVCTGCQNWKLALEMDVYIAEDGAAAPAPSMLFACFGEIKNLWKV